VGEVDDLDSHTENAFNHVLAEAGYTIDVTGGDGYTVTLDSQSIKENNDILVAFLVNDTELPEQYYPLRLVGTGLENSQMVGQITRINVNVPPVPTPTAAIVPENNGSISITGLRAMEIVTIDAEGKDGLQEFQGVRLNALLAMAGLKDGASKVSFTASDNYTSEVNLSDILACPNALLAFTQTPGEYMIVLPDLPTSSWVKNVILLEVR
jgi:DMSO/TMAO reductase YedYZ molybdopterin-dependent catalytic subunit